MIEVEKFTPMDRGISPAYERNLYKMMGAPMTQLNHSELIQVQESQALGVRHRSGFSLREHKQRMRQQMQQSRDKSPTQVINYN